MEGIIIIIIGIIIGRIIGIIITYRHQVPVVISFVQKFSLELNLCSLNGRKDLAIGLSLLSLQFRRKTRKRKKEDFRFDGRLV